MKMKQFIEFDLHFKVPLDRAISLDYYYDMLADELGFELDISEKRFSDLVLGALAENSKALEYVQKTVLSNFRVQEIIKDYYINGELLSYPKLESLLKIKQKLDLKTPKKKYEKAVEEWHEEQAKAEQIELEKLASKLGFKLVKK